MLASVMKGMTIAVLSAGVATATECEWKNWNSSEWERVGLILDHALDVGHFKGDAQDLLGEKSDAARERNFKRMAASLEDLIEQVEKVYPEIQAQMACINGDASPKAQ